MAQVPDKTETRPERFAQHIRDLFAGRSNAVGTVTLTPNAATTVVPAINCGAGSRPQLQAITANAAAEVGNGTVYISAVASGQFTITHANSATTGRTFHWECFG